MWVQKFTFHLKKKKDRVESMDPLPSLRKPAVLSTRFFSKFSGCFHLGQHLSSEKVGLSPRVFGENPLLSWTFPQAPSPFSLSFLTVCTFTFSSQFDSYDCVLRPKPVSPLVTRAAVKSATGWVAHTRQIDFIPAVEAASPRSRRRQLWFPLWHLSLACGVVGKRDYLFFYALPD